MSDDKKSIIISKNFLSSSKSKKKKPKINNLMKGVSMKKKLLQQVKKHHNKTLKNQFSKNKKDYPSNSQEINSFDESLDYLDSVLKKQKQKKKEKEIQQKVEKERNLQKQIQNETYNQIQNQEITLPKKPTTSVELYHPKERIGNSVPITLKKAPPYGILKNGKKPTYRQYNQTLKNKTLKTFHGGEKKLQPLRIENKVNTVSPFIKERKDKLKSYMKSFNVVNKQKNNKKKITIREKRIKTTRKLGKKNNKVGILVKSDKTRKKIRSELDILKQVSLPVVKKYLKKRDLIKSGTNAPEHVLRQIYEDSILSGDIYNKNSDVLIHNYFNEKIEL